MLGNSCSSLSKKKKKKIVAQIIAPSDQFSWPVVDGQRQIGQFFLHGMTKLLNLTCVGNWEDKSYFSLTFMWESNKYREGTYNLQKSFSKFVIDKSYFSLTFIWESNKYRKGPLTKVIFKVCHGLQEGTTALWKVVVPSIQLDTSEQHPHQTLL